MLLTKSVFIAPSNRRYKIKELLGACTKIQKCLVENYKEIQRLLIKVSIAFYNTNLSFMNLLIPINIYILHTYISKII